MHTKLFYEKYVKRMLDFLLSLISIVILSPVFLILAAVVRMKMGTPIVFSQSRPGIDGKIFKMYKFRTMTNEKDENGNLLPDEMRLNKFGAFLRSTSLDELPELFNILKGDMAIVGPRPLLVEYLPLYTEEQARRHEVRPGMTGYAQVNGRNELSCEKKFELDVEYVDNITFLSDVKIIIKTIKTVFKREGISSGTSKTMEKFTGSPK